MSVAHVPQVGCYPGLQTQTLRSYQLDTLKISAGIASLDEIGQIDGVELWVD